MSTSDDQAGRPSEELASRPQQVKDHILVSALDSPSNASKTTAPPQGHQRLVFPDPVAFRYLEEDPATVVLARRQKLEGYEIYVVEQWACSRIHPTFIIATYTGDSSHSILVGILSVPKDESTWSSRMKVYFKAMSEYHAREKETPVGTLMVTNLSGFPSSLTVIAVPDGDVRSHREDFMVNENLKRLGCAGRAGLNLLNPQPSTIAKFHHLYRTSEAVPFYFSVMELVRLCQVSLSVYGKLAPAYADGLLCDVTENSINDWWSDIGAHIYNIEPNDGILGPSTVCALIGLLMGAFNRMKAFGAPVGKDVFDLVSTKRAIGHFQKSQRMPRTRRLDRQTLLKLHNVTAKTASGEGWTVQKAVKSTVAELSGKGGEMVMGIVGGREKAGIAEVETLDIERLSQLVTGTKARRLWQGKAARSHEIDTSGPFGSSVNDKDFRTDDQGNYMWISKHRDSAWSDTSLRKSDHADDPENRSGFGRFKDAVGLPGLRSHHLKHSREDLQTDVTSVQEMHDRRDERTPNPASGNDSPELQSKEDLPSQKNTSLASSANLASHVENNKSQISFQSQSETSQQAYEEPEPGPVDLADTSAPISRIQTNNSQLEEVRRVLSTDETYRSFFSDHPNDTPQALGLKRTQSSSTTKPVNITPQNPRINRLPRCLSFSTIEDVVLTWDDNTSPSLTPPASVQVQKPPSSRQSLLSSSTATALLLQKASKLTYLETTTLPFTNLQISLLTSLDASYQHKQDALNTSYLEQLETFQTTKVTARDVLADERAALMEGLRRVEMLGAKLDYEVGGLETRIREVEDGVGEFEGVVKGIEARVGELVGGGKIREREREREKGEAGEKERGNESDTGRKREGWWVYLKKGLRRSKH